MQTGLLFKTYLIFSLEIFLIYAAVYAYIIGCRRAAKTNTPFFGLIFEETHNAKGQLDLMPIDNEEGSENYKKISELYGGCFFLFVCVLSALAIADSQGAPLFVGIALMTCSGLTLAPILGLCLIEIDENYGLKMFSLILFSSYACFCIGIFSGIDFNFLAPFIGIALLILVFYNLTALVVTGMFAGPMAFYSGTTKKNMSLFGMATFLALMVYQSNLITKLAKQGENNDWRSAFEFAHELYLTFINLVWQLMQNLGASGG